MMANRLNANVKKVVHGRSYLSSLYTHMYAIPYGIACKRSRSRKEGAKAARQKTKGIRNRLARQTSLRGGRKSARLYSQKTHIVRAGVNALGSVCAGVKAHLARTFTSLLFSHSLSFKLLYVYTQCSCWYYPIPLCTTAQRHAHGI